MKRKQSVPLLDVIADCVAAMSMQIKREQEEWIIPSDTALEVWNAALAQAVQALNNYGGVHIDAIDRHAALAITINSPVKESMGSILSSMLEQQVTYTIDTPTRQYNVLSADNARSTAGVRYGSFQVLPDGSIQAIEGTVSDDTSRF